MASTRSNIGRVRVFAITPEMMQHARDWFWSHRSEARERAMQFGNAMRYPVCCMQFFAGPWEEDFFGSQELHTRYNAIVRHFNIQPGYILCPQCLADEIHHVMQQRRRR